LFLSIIPLQSKVFAANDLGAYYVQDSKYDVCSTKQEYEKWENDLIAKIKQSGIKENLFAHKNGGGPNGAQWNPQGNLFIIATFDDKGASSKAKAYSVKILLNDIEQKEKISWHSSNNKSHIFSFVLSRVTWEKYLRKIKPQDYPFIYSRPINELYPGPEVGEVFDLKVNIYQKSKQTIKLHKVFFAAFGE